MGWTSGKPVSYTRLSQVLSSVGGKITVPTTSSYICFYFPEDELAIQVSYSISRDIDTREREVGALQKLPKALACKRRIILTYDEQQIIEDEYGKIEVIPCWKWMLGIE